MKRFVAFISIVVMIFTFTACGAKVANESWTKVPSYVKSAVKVFDRQYNVKNYNGYDNTAYTIKYTLTAPDTLDISIYGKKGFMEARIAEGITVLKSKEFEYTGKIEPLMRAHNIVKDMAKSLSVKYRPLVIKASKSRGSVELPDQIYMIRLNYYGDTVAKSKGKDPILRYTYYVNITQTTPDVELDRRMINMYDTVVNDKETFNRITGYVPED